MEVISIQHPYQNHKYEFPELAMAFGYFDGVHLGHQKVIKKAKEIAKENGFHSAVMTFDPHPSVILSNNEKQLELITPLKDKIDYIARMDIDYLFIVQFTKGFADLLPQEFVDQYVIGLNVKHVIAGFDFTYGRMGKGTMETLPFHSREQFTYTVVPKFTNQENEKVSSTLIRSRIRTGKVIDLPSLLGRFYTTKGIVIHGDKRGRTIGFPTANIDLTGDYLIPPLGVYCVRVNIRGTWYDGVCNIGFKPTFKDERESKPSIEVYIFDFDQEIYGQVVTVEWHLHLRSEKKFSGASELINQIEKDKQNTIGYFADSFNPHIMK